ncbi:MAG: hypothetical protein JWR85_2090 [Marmoricola sp.]|nr:hypothetical protein [Marmoricola sp.]
MRALLGLLLLTAVGCGQETPIGAVQDLPGPATRWARLADSPLSPRQGPVSGFVDGRAVFVGGDPGPPCPPSADCAGPVSYAVDGAAYDLEEKTWTPITDAPIGIPDLAPHAVVGKHLFVKVNDKLLDYDAARDRWTIDKVPGASPDWFSLAVDGPRLVLTSGSDEQVWQPDRVLDTRTGAWSTLPNDPFRLSFDRVITPTGEGLVLTTKQIEANGSPADPALVRAALLPRGSDRWTRLPDSDQIGGSRWVWNGRRMVDPTLGGADGGETNGYGRTIPYGGILDPVPGTWSRLPEAPPELTGGWPVEAVDGPVVAAEGWLYDDTARTWTLLTRPKGAPPTAGVAVWAGDTLLVLGGANWDAADEPDQWTAKRVYSTKFWAHRLSR